MFQKSTVIRSRTRLQPNNPEVPRQLNALPRPKSTTSSPVQRLSCIKISAQQDLASYVFSQPVTRFGHARQLTLANNTRLKKHLGHLKVPLQSSTCRYPPVSILATLIAITAPEATRHPGIACCDVWLADLGSVVIGLVLCLLVCKRCWRYTG